MEYNKKYFDKYIKYKTKYTHLKNNLNLGGNSTNNNDLANNNDSTNNNDDNQNIQFTQEELKDMKEKIKILQNQTMETTLETINKIERVILEQKCNSQLKNITGGFIPNKSHDIFLEYINNGTTKLLKQVNSSAFGILLQTKLNLDSIQSIEPNMLFYNPNIKRFREKDLTVQNLCIKIILNHEKLDNYNIYSHNAAGEIESVFVKKYFQNLKESIKEIEIQNIVSRTTNTFFEPTTPLILYSNFFLPSEAIELLNFIKSKNEYNLQLKETLNELIIIIRRNNSYLTIIAMDLINPISMTKSESVDSENMLLKSYELVRTIINSKILPLDTHSGNFICVHDEDYFSNYYNKRYYLIDFGICAYINDDTYDKILQYYQEGKIYEIFFFLNGLIKKDDFLNFKNFVKNIEKNYRTSEDFNKKINFLIKKRNDRTKELLSNDIFRKFVIDNNIFNFNWINYIGNKLIDNPESTFSSLFINSEQITIPNKKTHFENIKLKIQKMISGTNNKFIKNPEFKDINSIYNLNTDVIVHHIDEISDKISSDLSAQSVIKNNDNDLIVETNNNDNLTIDTQSKKSLFVLLNFLLIFITNLFSIYKKNKITNN